jgi:hypothetical protein
MLHTGADSGVDDLDLQELHLVTRAGWLKLLQSTDSFRMRDVEEALGASRQHAALALIQAQDLGLIEDVGRHGLGGARHWARTARAERVCDAVVAMLAQDAGPPNVLAVVALGVDAQRVIDTADGDSLKEALFAAVRRGDSFTATVRLVEQGDVRRS